MKAILLTISFLEIEMEICNDAYLEDSEKESDEEEEQLSIANSPFTTPTKKRQFQTVSRLTVEQKIIALDYYESINKKAKRNEGNKQWHPISMTHTFIRETFNRPTYQKSSVRYLLKHEGTIRKKAKTNRSKMVMDCPRAGRYPEMEEKLSTWLKEARDQDIIVETWMLSLEGKKILHDLYPWKFHNPEFDEEVEIPFNNGEGEGNSHDFKFSSSWARSFLKRYNWSLRTVINKKNWTLEKKLGMKLVEDFHINTRAFQLTEMKDPVYGIAPPANVFNLDQVPINLAQSCNKTINEKGAKEVYDGVTKGSDMKRFCTLNLMIPMEINDDSSNIPKPHIIFSASSYKTGEDWSASEREEWPDNVIISFQENAWVERRGFKYGVSNMLKEINRKMMEKGDVGVLFADNLSTHKSEESLTFFKNELPASILQI